ncbi:hypothetical protein A2U01_0076976, partial [Trifolium medium]|nr:hypothetical protein [Trifolium medium]
FVLTSLPVYALDFFKAPSGTRNLGKPRGLAGPLFAYGVFGSRCWQPVMGWREGV